MPVLTLPVTDVHCDDAYGLNDVLIHTIELSPSYDRKHMEKPIVSLFGTQTSEFTGMTSVRVTKSV